MEGWSSSCWRRSPGKANTNTSANHPKGWGGTGREKIRDNQKQRKGRWSPLGWRARERLPQLVMGKCWGALTAAVGQAATQWVQRVAGDSLAEKKWQGEGRQASKIMGESRGELAHIRENHRPSGTRVSFYLSPR